MSTHEQDSRFPGPAVIAVRGPSGSGKTRLIEELICAVAGECVTTAYLKRTHHDLDLPGKGSSRVWAQMPDAMVLRAPDRLQLTLPAGSGRHEEMLALVPPGVELAIIETHSPTAYTTLLCTLCEPAAGERVVWRWAPHERLSSKLLDCVRRQLSRERQRHAALRPAALPEPLAPFEHLLEAN